MILFGALQEDGEVKYALEIPYALSILAHNHPAAVVTGLNEVPEDERPPLYIHYLFDVMVTIGVFLMVVAAAYWLGSIFRWKWTAKKWFFGLLVAGGPLAMAAIEAGWYLAEVGRQPWILRGYMKTAEGATSSAHVDTMLVLFCLLYMVLVIASATVLIRMFRRNPVERELAERANNGEVAP